MSHSDQKTGELTKNQSLVLNLLRTEARPYSAYTILDNLRGEGLKAPPQVYRALETLQAKGLVHRLESENAFVACCKDGCDARHAVVAFAICDECGSATEFDSTDLQTAVGSIAGAMQFQTRRTVLELRGVCGECEAS